MDCVTWMQSSLMGSGLWLWWHSWSCRYSDNQKPTYNHDLIYHGLVTHFILWFHLWANSLSWCGLQCHVEALVLMAGMHQKSNFRSGLKRTCQNPTGGFPTSTKLFVGVYRSNFLVNIDSPSKDIWIRECTCSCGLSYFTTILPPPILPTMIHHVGTLCPPLPGLAGKSAKQLATNIGEGANGSASQWAFNLLPAAAL